jgi:toxin-antitoxin system PIN domain toxin
VILVDTNVLIYAVDKSSPRHGIAKVWLEEKLSGSEGFALAWIVILAFLRLTTRPGISAYPLPAQAALDIVGQWLSHPSVSVLNPGPRHGDLLRALLLSSGASGNLTTDAHLAALALEHNATLYSFDHDFARFPELRWRYPGRDQ